MDATIIIPNYNTGPLLELCLKSIRRFSDPVPRILVVDNGSDDASVAFAETCPDAEVIHRPDDNRGAVTHAASLDAGVEQVETPFFVTLDSDTYARRSDWLDLLLGPLRLDDEVAVVGALKFVREKGWVRRIWDAVRGAVPAGPEYEYIRPCHAAYRLAPVREKGLSFAPAHNPETGGYMTTGERLYHDLLEAGWKDVKIPRGQMMAAIVHIGHATMVRNPETFEKLKRKTRKRGERRIEAVLDREEVKKILAGGPEG